MLWRTLLSLLLVCCVLFCGCGKKKKADEAVEQAEIESVATEEGSDDIFDEFYDDEEETKKEEPVQQEQFTSPSSTPQFDPNGRYVVQVSCVLSRGIAEDVVAKLENKGYPAYIAAVDNPTPELIGTYHRIRIGGFNGVSLAKDFAENYLTPEGYEYWVDNRSNDNVGMGGYEGLGQSSGGGYESGYTSEPAQTEPAEEWSPAQTTPTTTTDEWGTTETATPQTEPATTPDVTAPVTSEPATPQTTPETGTTTLEDEWGETEDEWGADTSGW